MANPADNQALASLAARHNAMLDKRSAQHGYVMVLSIILLLVITLMSVSMAKSFFLEEGMAGNIREKNRSFSAAQAALNYGEALVAQGGLTPTSTCGSTKLSAATICTVPVSIVTNQDSSPLQVYFQMPSALVSTYMNVNVNIAKDTFYALPGVYVQYIGREPGSGQMIFSITAYGYGETPNSLSIVGSMFKVQPKTLQINASSGAGNGN